METFLWGVFPYIVALVFFAVFMPETTTRARA